MEHCLNYPPHCPPDRCTCWYGKIHLAILNLNGFYFKRDTCDATGRLAGVEGTDVYCMRKCLRYPTSCPRDECHCYDSQNESAEGNVDDTENAEIVETSESESENAQQTIQRNDDDGFDDFVVIDRHRIYAGKK